MNNTFFEKTYCVWRYSIKKSKLYDFKYIIDYFEKINNKIIQECCDQINPNNLFCWYIFEIYNIDYNKDIDQLLYEYFG